ncbi:MAG: polyprenyl synthetase family protein [Propionibacteriaceae bacterium]|jgi:geranylgeranyl diphosphate synthase type I|nr:polyprenyl synthetase family protein [Propionibacteriaceae bacterium]
MRLDPQQPLNAAFRTAVQARLDHFMATQRDLLALTGNRLDPVWEQVQHFTRGGKRIRPAFCYWGYVAAAGADAEPPQAIMDIAASLDLLHLSALVHDDLIDDSDVRRGGPAAHRFFESFHRDRGWQGDSRHFGNSAAVLLGDLLFTWSMAMVEQATITGERLKRARPYLDAMRSEVLAGQFLDLIHQTRPSVSDDWQANARLVMEFKTSKYTVSRPVQIGAALGLAGDDIQQGLGSFGAHVGDAFQMRDDLLGLFGDPEVTGKPAGDDIREGKKTVIIGYALQQASASDAERLLGMLGNPDVSEADIDEARRILTDSGAVEATERAIVSEAATGMRYLHRLDLSPEGTYALMALVHAAVERTA